MGRLTELDNSGAGMLRSLTGVGLDSMMLVGDKPWHFAANEDMIKLLAEGTKVTSADINKVAGLDWNVYQTPVYFRPEVAAPAIGLTEGGFKEAKLGSDPMYFLNIRDDLHTPVGVVKKRYRVFQNSAAPTFLDNLVDSGDAVYETAGSLHAGSQTFWLMKLPATVTVAGDPREGLETYILLTNSHDGSTAIITSVVTVRVVCQNTLAYALSTALRTQKIKHTESAKEKFALARKTLEIGYTYQDELAVIGEKMINTSFSDAEFEAFLNDLVPTPEKVTIKGKVKNQRGITMAENTKESIVAINKNHPTQVHIKGTLWGAVQAVSYYSDHEQTARETEGSSAAENRFKRVMGYSGTTLSQKSFQKALALV